LGEVPAWAEAEVEGEGKWGEDLPPDREETVFVLTRSVKTKLPIKPALLVIKLNVLNVDRRWLEDN